MLKIAKASVNIVDVYTAWKNNKIRAVFLTKEEAEKIVEHSWQIHKTRGVINGNVVSLVETIRFVEPAKAPTDEDVTLIVDSLSTELKQAVFERLKKEFE